MPPRRPIRQAAQGRGSSTSFRLWWVTSRPPVWTVAVCGPQAGLRPDTDHIDHQPHSTEVRRRIDRHSSSLVLGGRVADALRTRGYEVRQADVLVAEMPHKPGMLHRVAEALAAEKIDIHHLYATATGGQDRCLVVLSTANNDRVFVLLNAFPSGS